MEVRIDISCERMPICLAGKRYRARLWLRNEVKTFRAAKYVRVTDVLVPSGGTWRARWAFRLSARQIPIFGERMPSCGLKEALTKRRVPSSNVCRYPPLPESISHLGGINWDGEHEVTIGCRTGKVDWHCFGVSIE